MQKIIILCALLLLFVSNTWAQFQNKNAHIVIKAGTTLHSSSDFVNQNGGIVDYAGIIEVDGDFINLGNLSSNAGAAIKFSGDADAQLRTGSVLLHKLIINSAAGTKISILDQTIIHQAIEFTSNGTYIELGNQHLFMTGEGNFVGADANNFMLTSGTGELKKAGLGTVPDFTFPIGFDENSYNPIYIKQGGTSETIGVRCLENVKYSGLSGNVIDEKVVAAAWDISESTLGENDLTLRTFWDADDEMVAFDRTKTGISHWNGFEWTMIWDELNAAIGANLFFVAREGITAVGMYAVGNEPLTRRFKLSMKILLEGPENSGIMKDDLRGLVEFPLTEPFAGLGYTHVKYGGNETTAANQLDDFGDNTNIVDWIFVELRDKNDISVVLATKSVFVRKDGELVDIEGGSPFYIHALPDDDYYIAIRHRNHFGICSANTYALNNGLSSFDFTDASIPLFGNNPTTMLGGKVAMIAGDANQDGKIKYNGNANDRNKLLFISGLLTPNNAPKGYYLEDLNLDGSVKYNGNGNDRNVILKTVGLFTPNNTVEEQLPE